MGLFGSYAYVGEPWIAQQFFSSPLKCNSAKEKMDNKQ